MEGNPPLTTLKRGFEIIDLLRELDSARPAEIAEELDLPHSTVYDYLRSLESTGYLTKEDKEYRLSYEFLTIGGEMMYDNYLFRTAKPEMRKLALRTDELVSLLIRKDTTGLVLNQEGSDQSLNLKTHPGSEIPLHSHAGGKTILAHLSEEELDDIVESEGLFRITDDTITDYDELEEELQTIRDTGWAIDWDEHVNGLGVISKPINIQGENRGSLSLILPTGRIQDEEYQEELLRELRSTIDTIVLEYRFGTDTNDRR